MEQRGGSGRRWAAKAWCSEEGGSGDGAAQREWAVQGRGALGEIVEAGGCVEMGNLGGDLGLGTIYM